MKKRSLVWAILGLTYQLADAAQVRDRYVGQVEADDHDDGAGDDRGHQPLDPLVADDHDNDADQGVDRAADDDSAEGGGDVVPGPDRLGRTTTAMNEKLEPR